MGFDQCVCLQAVSGLKIKLGKFKLVSVGDGLNVEALVGILGCKASKLLMRNLGLPLGSALKEKAVWNSNAS